MGSRSPNGDGKWGQADLAGSLYEWVLDSVADVKPGWKDKYPVPCDDCANLVSDLGLIRGGGWFWGAADLASSWRNANGHDVHDPVLGARCARDP